MSNLTASIEAVYRRIHAAAERVGRDPQEVTLVVVTKTHPLETVLEAYQAGLRHFGENRADEGNKKVGGLRKWLAANPNQARPTWHFIGHLQSRQVGDILGNFDLIHSVDSLKLAQRINRLAERDGFPPLDILLQCNVSGEAAKSGFNLEQWSSNKAQLTGFIETIRQIANLNNVVIRGLMTIAPIAESAEETRPVFFNLAALRSRMRQELPQVDWTQMSMGMTDDFEVAIEEGATIIRVGRAIFGERLTT